MINCSKKITKASAILAMIIMNHPKGKNKSVLKSWEVYLNIISQMQELGYCLIVLQDWEQFINVIVGLENHVDLCFLLIIYWEVWCIFLSLLDIAGCFFFIKRQFVTKVVEKNAPGDRSIALSHLSTEAALGIDFRMCRAVFLSNHCCFFQLCFSKQVNTSQFRYFPRIVILWSENNGVVSSQKYSGIWLVRATWVNLLEIEALIYLNKI